MGSARAGPPPAAHLLASPVCSDQRLGGRQSERSPQLGEGHGELPCRKREVFPEGILKTKTMILSPRPCAPAGAGFGFIVLG